MAARLRDIKKAARKWGVDLAETKSGKHPFKFTKPGAGSYPVPAHNGLRSEIADCYIKGLCRHFGISEDEFRQELSGQPVAEQEEASESIGPTGPTGSTDVAGATGGGPILN